MSNFNDIRPGDTVVYKDFSLDQVPGEANRFAVTFTEKRGKVNPLLIFPDHVVVNVGNNGHVVNDANFLRVLRKGKTVTMKTPPVLPKVGERIGSVDGPGVYAKDNPGTVTAIVTDRWGTHAVVQMDNGTTKTCHGLNSGPGIGWHSITASWVLREKGTGKVIMETFDRKVVEALNTDRYEAVPILTYLQGVNRKIKEGGAS